MEQASTQFCCHAFGVDGQSHTCAS
jgi:hypothetical protein